MDLSPDISLIPLVTMFLTIVDGRLIALERGLVNPLQPLALILWNSCASHQEPACGKLCLGVPAISCQLIPENALFEVLLHAIAIPVGSTTVLL